MSSLDKWADVTCPKCKQKKVHAWYFDSDCRGNSSSSGVNPCQSCGYQPNEQETNLLVSELWLM